MTPAFQRFKTKTDQLYGRALPQQLRDDFRRGSLPLMKWANILTFNTRAIVLYISVLIGQPWIYPVFEITVMSALFFHMRNQHEKLCDQLQQSL